MDEYYVVGCDSIENGCLTAKNCDECKYALLKKTHSNERINPHNKLSATICVDINFTDEEMRKFLNGTYEVSHNILKRILQEKRFTICGEAHFPIKEGCNEELADIPDFIDTFVF